METSNDGSSTESAATQAFRSARSMLLKHREDREVAYDLFRWPELETFNWAYDWFDVLAAEQPDAVALWIVEDDGAEAQFTYSDLSTRSTQLAGWLRAEGVDRGDAILVLLGNRVELWETMLACIRLGAVVIPATTLLAPADLRDRVERGHVRHVICSSADAEKFADVPGDWTRIAMDDPVPGWLRYDDSLLFLGDFEPEVETRPDETLLLYFTSGTTASPKLVEHTHTSYPVGHLSTLYWIGLQPGDIHLNISSPGWAKHAWSCFFAPWNAGATVFVHNYSRFSAAALLALMERCKITTFCAPPTVWRMLVQEDLAAWAGRLSVRELVGAGEPLNPEVIDQVRRRLGITIRDGFGQTETTAVIGNSPGQEVRFGSMGRPLPGYRVVLVDLLTAELVTEPGAEGEICLDLAERPMGLMAGYRNDPARTDDAMRGGVYHTGDVGTADADGYITYVGRADDVFKASDYRISPFELESVLIEHEAVAEAAVVPSPDPVRLAVPKAYVVLAPGWEPTSDTAYAILRHCREQLAPYKRVRRLEFGELPKTISGKIRRVDLRRNERDRAEGSPTGSGSPDAASARGTTEWWEEDFPELKSP